MRHFGPQSLDELCILEVHFQALLSFKVLFGDFGSQVLYGLLEVKNLILQFYLFFHLLSESVHLAIFVGQQFLPLSDVKFGFLLLYLVAQPLDLLVLVDDLVLRFLHLVGEASLEKLKGAHLR